MALTQKQVAQLYVALFDRAPTKSELDSWYNDAVSNNKDMNTLAGDMLYAALQVVGSDADAASFYPQYVNLDPSDRDQVKAIIENVYKLLLGKDYTTDPQGIDGWVDNVINNGGTFKALGDTLAGIVYIADQYATGAIQTDDPETLKAAQAFANKSEVALYVAETVPSNDPDGDGKVNFDTFKQIIETVTDDPATIETAKAEADKYVPVNVELTSGTDTIVGSMAADIFKAPLLTLNDGDSIDGKEGVDTLQATINQDVNNLKLNSVEKVEITTYGNHYVNLTNATGITTVADIKSTGTLSLKNMTKNMGLKIVGNSQKVNANYNGLTGTDDKLKLSLDSATNATISVTNGFESLALDAQGSNSIASFANMPSKVTLTGEGSLAFQGNVAISTLDASASKVTIATGKDTNNDGFNDSAMINTQAGGSVIQLADGDNNIYVNDNSNGGDVSTIISGAGNDKITIVKNSGEFVVSMGDGDDAILVGGTKAYTTNTVIKGEGGNDSLVLTNNQNNAIVLSGIEDVTLKNTATGTNSLIADQAMKVKIEVGNAGAATTFGIKKLSDGTTVSIVNATNQTAGFKAGTISFANVQDTNTIELNAKGALTNALTINNVKNLTINANSALTGAKSLKLKATETLTLNAAKTLKLGNISDTATTDSLKNVKIAGSATVTVGNISPTTLEKVDITAVKTLKAGNIGTTTKDINLTEIKLVSDQAGVNLGTKKIGNNKADITKVDIKAAKSVAVQTVTAKSLGTVTLGSTSAKVTVTKVKAAATLSTLKATAAKTLKAKTVSAKTIDTISLKSSGAGVTLTKAVATNSLKSLTINAAKSAKATTIKSTSKNVGDISIKSTQATVSIGTLSAAKGSIKSLSLKGMTKAKVTTSVKAKTLGNINIASTKGAVTVGAISATGTKAAGTIAINAKTTAKVTNIKGTATGKGLSNVKVTAGKNVQVSTISAKDTDGFKVTLKAGATGKITNAAGTKKAVIKNTKGNISSVVLSGKSAKVAISAVTGSGYVKNVNANGVTSGATLTIKSNDASAAITSKTTISLGGNNSKTNTVNLSGKVDAVDLTSGAANDTIKLNVTSKVNASFNTGAGNDKVSISSKTAGSTISVNGGSGDDKVVLQAGSAFNTTDKIKDFNNGNDQIVIDLKASGTKVGTKTNANDIPNSAVATKKLKIWNTAGAVKTNASVKTTLASGAAKSLKAITTKALWVGKSLAVVTQGTKKNFVLNTKSGKKTIKATAAGTAVIFYYDTDDHKLEIYKAKASATSKFTATSHKTVATVTLANGANFTAADIAIF